jgi:2'-5' RNA ligase
MATSSTEQTTLFGTPIRCEYYPVLLPDPATLEEIKTLNKFLVQEIGLKPSQLTKQPHISIDGILCEENDQRVIADIAAFLSYQEPIPVEFTEVGYFPARGGLILKLGITNSESVLDFNRTFMTAIGGKITKLNLHLTLARYVNPELLELLKNPEVPYPKLTRCDSVALMKKEYKAKGAYTTITTIPFGKTGFQG